MRTIIRGNGHIWAVPPKANRFSANYPCKTFRVPPTRWSWKCTFGEIERQSIFLKKIGANGAFSSPEWPIDEKNGCLWFVPGSHRKKLRQHRTASANSHVLTTDDIEEVYAGKAHPVPLEKGDAVFWTGRTLHYANGNFTNMLRRTYILNFRPQKAIEFERKNGYDHLKNGFKNFDPSETAGDVYKNVNVDYKIPDNVI